MAPLKVLLVANTSWYLYNFRLGFARALKDQGYQVIFVAPLTHSERDYHQKIRASGFEFQELKLIRQSMNPFLELYNLYNFIKLYRQIQPNFCHHFTIKCVLYGSLAALFNPMRGQTIRIINSITGLGPVFIQQNRLMKIIRSLVFTAYRIVLKNSKTRVIFQNSDDYAAFAQANLINANTSYLIRSSGVDLNRFQAQPQTFENQTVTFLFASRLLKEKGILELLTAALQLNQAQVNFKLLIAGSADSGNRSSLTPEQIAKGQKTANVQFLGHCDNIDHYLKIANVVVLPSYREGVPKILLEAAAMQRALIASNVPGCREIVIQQQTGLLVTAKNELALAEAMRYYCLNHDKIIEHGQNARQKVLKEFSESLIAEQTIKVYQSFL